MRPKKAEGKTSAVDAAAKILGESKEPLTTKQMIEAMESKGYWKSRSKFESFASQTPRLDDYATFRAVGERLRTPWPEWDSRHRKCG